MPEPQAPPAPDSKPETPQARDLALERLASTIENLRTEIAAQGSVQNMRLTSVLDAIARFDTTMKMFANELQTLKRGHLELVDRVAALESHAFRDSTKKKGRRRAAKSR